MLPRKGGVGTEIHLEIEDFSLDWSKKGIGIDHGFLFQEADRTRRRCGEIDYDYFRENPSAARFKKASEFLMKEDGPREAAFNLHQGAERLYHCVLLVCTFYTPLCRAPHYAELAWNFGPRQGVADNPRGIVSLIVELAPQ